MKLDVKIKKAGPEARALAYVEVVVDGWLALNGMRIVEGKKGLFVSMPARKDTATGEYHDHYKAITKESHKQLQETVLKAFREMDVSF